jgi:hypothetical protein
MSDEDDVSKSWRDPVALRAAIAYAAVVVVVAAAILGWFAATAKDEFALAAAVPAVLFIGAVGAFVQTYRVWRARGTWPIWQGAGWFLLALALLTLSVPAMSVLHGLP